MFMIVLVLIARHISASLQLLGNSLAEFAFYSLIYIS